MNSSKFRFVLDLHSTQSQISIPVTKGDTAGEGYINLSDGSLPYIIGDGCLAKIEIKRPTGTFLESFCPIENNTTVKYDFSQDEITRNTAVVAGYHDCTVTIYDAEGNSIASARFSMVVSDRVVNRDDINIADEDLTAIDSMIAAEVSRQAAEMGRVNAEADRQSNEAKRQEALEQLEAALKQSGGGLVDYRIKTTLNTSDYKLTVALTDTMGNVIDSDTVDIPLESVVVNGSEENGIISLVLHNGNTIRFGIGDLVEGLTSPSDVERMIANAITATLNTEV